VSGDLVAPQNLDAEESVLGAIIYAAGAAGAKASARVIEAVRARGLQAGDFYRESHALIYQAALALDDRSEPSEVLALERELETRGRLAEAGGRTRLAELAHLATATVNAGHYAGLVVEAAARRRLFAVGLACQTAAMNGSVDAGLRERLAEFVHPQPGAGSPWRRQAWSDFRDQVGDEHRWLVEGLLPAGMLAFVAGPPKKGKTWLGIGLALAVATGAPLFGEYAVPEARSVLYVALEGSRVGLRARIGALARGLGLDPDGDDLGRLAMLYRPRPFDLADLTTAAWLHREAEDADAALVVVDVLRAAARFKENVAEDFALVRDGLEPLLADGRTVAPLHHFGKLTETQKERSPGERMAGTGAMYGALDVGFLITRSDSGARRMRLDVEARDFAAPDALGIVITGTGSGEHGGFTFADAATLEIDPTAVEGRDLARETEELFAKLGERPDAEAKDVWRTLSELAEKKHGGIGANKDELRVVLEESPDRFVLLAEARRVGRHGSAKPWGTVAMLRDLEEREKVARDAEPPEPPSPAGRQELLVEQVASPKGESQPSHLLHEDSRADPSAELPEPPEKDNDDAAMSGDTKEEA
jgi:hypothetical protein